MDDQYAEVCILWESAGHLYFLLQPIFRAHGIAQLEGNLRDYFGEGLARIT